MFFPFAKIFNIHNCTACTRLVLFLSFVTGSLFYILERQHDIWYTESLTKDSPQHFHSSPGLVTPILYHEGSMVSALYLTNAKLVQAILPKTMEPLTLPWPYHKQSMVSIAMSDYRNTTLGAYQQMGLLLHAKKAGSSVYFLGYVCSLLAHTYHLTFVLPLCDVELGARNAGTYVATSPVTTVTSKAALLEIWNYNAYMANIKSNWSDTSLMTFELESEFKYELDSKGGSYLPTFTMASFPLVTLSERDQSTEVPKQLVAATVVTGNKVNWGGASKVELMGNGPTVNRMRELKLDTLSPMAVFRTDGLVAHWGVGSAL